MASQLSYETDRPTDEKTRPIEKRRLSPEEATAKILVEAMTHVNALERAAQGVDQQSEHTLKLIGANDEDGALHGQSEEIGREMKQTYNNLHHTLAEVKKKIKEHRETSKDLDKKFHEDFERNWNEEVASGNKIRQEEDWFKGKHKKTENADDEETAGSKETERVKNDFLSDLKGLDKDTIAIAGSIFEDLASTTASAETIAGTMNILAARGVDQKKLHIVYNFIKQNYPAMLPSQGMLQVSETKIGDKGLEEEWEEAVTARPKNTPKKEPPPSIFNVIKNSWKTLRSKRVK